MKLFGTRFGEISPKSCWQVLQDEGGFAFVFNGLSIVYFGEISPKPCWDVRRGEGG